MDKGYASGFPPLQTIVLVPMVISRYFQANRTLPVLQGVNDRVRSICVGNHPPILLRRAGHVELDLGVVGRESLYLLCRTYHAASPTACQLRGYSRTGTQKDCLGEGSPTVHSTGPRHAYLHVYMHVCALPH